MWDGKDDKGQLVDSGIYMYKINSQYFVKANKMILVK